MKINPAVLMSGLTAGKTRRARSVDIPIRAPWYVRARPLGPADEGVAKPSSDWFAWGRSAVVALALAAVACGPATESPKPPIESGEWREFEGSWNAVGVRSSIPLGTDRRGSIIDLRGSMLLAGSGRPGVGFRAEVIGLVDTETGLQGRSVWTDERGDQVFSELSGEGTAANNRVTGTILGGTGRYAGVMGSYEFAWRSVIESEEGSIQGRADGLKGRVRFGQSGTGGSKP